jgi:hypothetical protein
VVEEESESEKREGKSVSEDLDGCEQEKEEEGRSGDCERVEVVEEEELGEEEIMWGRVAELVAVVFLEREGWNRKESRNKSVLVRELLERDPSPTDPPSRPLLVFCVARGGEQGGRVGLCSSLEGLLFLLVVVPTFLLVSASASPASASSAAAASTPASSTSASLAIPVIGVPSGSEAAAVEEVLDALQGKFCCNRRGGGRERWRGRGRCGCGCGGGGRGECRHRRGAGRGGGISSSRSLIYAKGLLLLEGGVKHGF